MIQTERDTMLLDGKNQYGENNNTAQNNIQIQCNHYQKISMVFVLQKVCHKQTVRQAEVTP